MQAILTKVLEIAPSDARVVILGETGTGKGLLARTIHALSRPPRQAVRGRALRRRSDVSARKRHRPPSVRRPPAAKNTREGRGDFAFLRKFWPGFQTPASPSIIVTGFLASGSQALLEGKREDHACVATSAEAYLRKRAAAPRV
jgi:ABC-type dipeptide/oligopeptide/nickel transport system ATPase component